MRYTYWASCRKIEPKKGEIRMNIQKLLILTLILTSIVLTGCNIKLSSHAVDPKEYLNADNTPAEVYQKNAKGQFYNPFNFSHTDFGRLILISIDDHPLIKTVELVVQNDNKGAFVVVYYHNGKVENYINTRLSIDKKYLKPNSDWEIAGEQDFDFAFEDTKNGISFALDITIKSGQRIKIKLRENHADAKRYSFLAAIGADLSEVKRFPFIYLREAGFIPVEGTEVSFEIDGKKMELTKVPIKVEGQNCFKTVYSLTPLPFFWNEEREIYLSPEKITDTKKYKKDNTEYFFTDNNGHKEIERITYKANGHSASYRFSPSFPDIASLKTGSEIKGKFCLGVDDIDGVICGKYSVINTNGEITINFQPEKCWQPMPGKDWVSAYRYHAKIKSTTDDRFKIQSEWTVE